MSTSSFSHHRIDRDALLRVVEPVVRAHAAEVVDIELKPERGGWVLRVYVEKAGAAADRLSTKDAAVDLELCANVSRDLSTVLDVADLVPHAYHLEVSSPGIERPLRGELDFVRFRGCQAKVKVREAIDGRRVYVGQLDGVENGHVRLIEGASAGQRPPVDAATAPGGRVVELPLSAIESASLVFEFGGPGGRPGAPRARGETQVGRRKEHKGKH